MAGEIEIRISRQCRYSQWNAPAEKISAAMLGELESYLSEAGLVEVENVRRWTGAPAEEPVATYQDQPDRKADPLIKVELLTKALAVAS